MKRALTQADFASVVDQLKDYAVFLLDAAGGIATWNHGAQQLMGYGTKEIVGQNVARFFTDEDVAIGTSARSLETARREGRCEFEAWRMRKDGSRFWANVAVTAMVGAAGELVGFIVITRDLSERNQAREEHRQREIAEAALRERDMFLSMASHELRSPLSALKLYVQTIAEELRSGDTGRLLHKLPSRLDRVQRQADRIDALVTRLLNASAIAAGQLHLHFEDIDLTELVATAVDRLSEAAQQSECEMIFRTNGALVGRWSAEHLENTIHDLLENAIKFGAGKPIAVKVKRDRAYAWISIQDQGGGIDVADQERIFERFQRLPDPRNCAGLGLGLWMGREVVSAMGGTITVDSRPGEGATFTIKLPLNASSSGVSNGR